jgi:hypothetical protein
MKLHQYKGHPASQGALYMGVFENRTRHIHGTDINLKNPHNHLPGSGFKLVLETPG